MVSCHEYLVVGTLETILVVSTGVVIFRWLFSFCPYDSELFEDTPSYQPSLETAEQLILVADLQPFYDFDMINSYCYLTTEKKRLIRAWHLQN